MDAHLPLSRPVTVGYSTAEFGLGAVELLLRLYLLIFYTDVVGLSPTITGIAIAIAIAWDAITDPLVGSLSDRTRTRFGKRLPYIVGGAFGVAGSLVLLFSPPALPSETWAFAYLLGSYILLNTCITLIAVPYVALGGDIAFERSARTELVGWRFVMFNLGGLFASIAPGLFSESEKPMAPAYGSASALIGVMVLLTATATALATRERDISSETQSSTLRVLVSSWRTVLSNKLFMILLAAYVVTTVGLGINGAVGLHYYTYFLGLEQREFEYVIAVFLLITLFSVPVWYRIAQKYGKKWPGFVGVLLLGLLIAVVYPLLPPDQLAPPIIVAVFAGSLTGAVILLEALVMDIVDYDELETGEHREGLYFGIWKMAAKMARGLSIAAAGYVLDLVGFEPNQVQTQETLNYLGLLFGPAVGGFFILGGLLFILLPYSNEEHDRVQQKLRVRKADHKPNTTTAHTHQTGALPPSTPK